MDRRQAVFFVLEFTGAFDHALLKFDIQATHLSVEAGVRQGNRRLTDHRLGQVLLQAQMVDRVGVLKRHNGHDGLAADHRQRQDAAARREPGTLAGRVGLQHKLGCPACEGSRHNIPLAFERNQHPCNGRCLCANRLTSDKGGRASISIIKAHTQFGRHPDGDVGHRRQMV